MSVLLMGRLFLMVAVVFGILAAPAMLEEHHSFDFSMNAFDYVVIPASAAESELGDAWESLKSSLVKAEEASGVEAMQNLDDARAIYVENFQPAARQVDPQSDAIVEGAFDKIRMFLQEGEPFEASLQRQAVDKTIYTISYLKIEEALDSGDAVEFLNWFGVMDKKFKISEKGDKEELIHAVNDIAEDSTEITEYSDTIKQELLAIFKLKTVEELEEAIVALEADNVNDARKFAYEGLYYYRTLHPSVVDKLGDADAQELLHEMEEAIEVADNEDLTVEQKLDKLKHISKEVNVLIQEYSGGDTSDVGLAISGIKDRLNLVVEEYHEAVEDGTIVDQKEYDETVVFLSKASEILSENRQLLVDVAESDVEQLEANINEIDSLVNSLGDHDMVSALVNDSLDRLESIRELSGAEAEDQTLVYLSNVRSLIKDGMSAYKEQDYDTAHSLVTEAYLDNYEFVEAPLAELDRDLMVDLEHMIREDLRAMIKNQEPVDSVESHVSNIMTMMDKAEKLLSGEEPKMKDKMVTEDPFEALEELGLENVGGHEFSPNMQMANGIEPPEVICETGMERLMKVSDGSAICVFEDSVERLMSSGYANRF